MNNSLTPAMLSSPAADLYRQLVPGVPPGDRWVVQCRTARGQMDRPGLGQVSRLGEPSRVEEIGTGSAASPSPERSRKSPG